MLPYTIRFTCAAGRHMQPSTSLRGGSLLERRYAMFGFGMPELIIILVIALVVVGPAKLPQLGQALGGSIRSFKKGLSSDEAARLDEK